jgi:hypothetical protein
MDLIEGSETSANINQTLGIHPKIETVKTEKGLRLITEEKQSVFRPFANGSYTCQLHARNN